jgi:O-antigen/teichoic acid export membrane protein
LNWLQKLLHNIGSQRDLGYVTIGNLVSTALGALLWFILASLMVAANYGDLNYHISIATILTAIGILGFDFTLTTFLAKGFHRFAYEANTLVALSGVLLFFLVLLGFNSLSTGLILLGMMFFTLSTAELLGKNRYREFMMVMVLQRVITLISVPTLYNLMGVDGALYGYALSYLPLSYRFFFTLRRMTLSFNVLRSNKKFFLHSYGTGISRTLVHFSDKLIIVPIFGLAIVGYYQFGLQMLTLVSIVPTIMYNYLLPQEASGRANSPHIVKVLGVTVSIIISIVLIILTPFLVQTLFPQFRSSILATQIVLLAGPLLTLSSIQSTTLLARNQSRDVLISAGAFLGVQYSLLALLGSLFELPGLSVATVAAAAGQAVYLRIANKLSAEV